MNHTLNKFITDLDEHMKKIELTDAHIKTICGHLGKVVIGRVRKTKKDVKLENVVHLHCLEEEVKRIVQGNRADMIYHYQEFVKNFVQSLESSSKE